MKKGDFVRSWVVSDVYGDPAGVAVGDVFEVVEAGSKLSVKYRPGGADGEAVKESEATYAEHTGVGVVETTFSHDSPGQGSHAHWMVIKPDGTKGVEGTISDGPPSQKHVGSGGWHAPH